LQKKDKTAEKYSKNRKATEEVKKEFSAPALTPSPASLEGRKVFTPR
jgi:hypothetical protein